MLGRSDDSMKKKLYFKLYLGAGQLDVDGRVLYLRALKLVGGGKCIHTLEKICIVL